MIRNYRDLEAWRSTMDSVEACYLASCGFPNDERFGLTSQLRRAAVSVPANIAEGQGRRHTPEFLNHLSLAYGSLMETETHLLIAQRLNFLDEPELAGLLKISAMTDRLINGLARALREKPAR